MIPVCVSAYGLNYIHEKNVTLNEMMRIQDIHKPHPSDHNMLTPGTIHGFNH